MPGLHGENKIIHKDRQEVPINRAGGEAAYAGDTLYFRAPGGGGYGDPLDRDIDYLEHDVINGYVSVESARRDYGAVIDEKTLLIDRKATEENRKKLRSEWKREKIFIDQKTKPFAGRDFRVVHMNEQVE